MRIDDPSISRRRIVEALERCGGNQTEAAKVLGMSRRTLSTRLDTYGLTRPRKGRSDKNGSAKNGSGTGGWNR